MRASILVLPAVLLVSAFAPLVAADPAPSPVDNGYLLMVHGTVHPRASAILLGLTGQFVPPAQEAEVVTAVNGVVTFSLIPYTVDTGVPVVVYDPVLVVFRATGDELMRLPANGDARAQPECTDETTIPGHEGPLAACLVFDVPATRFTGNEAVTMRVEFRAQPDTCVDVATQDGHGHGGSHGNGQGHGRGHAHDAGETQVVCTPGPLIVEDYDLAQHYQLHASMSGPALPVYDRAYADSLDLGRTPFVVENIVSAP